MDVITTIIYIILFVILMIFVLSIGMLRKFMPKKEIVLVLLVGFLIGSIGGAFFLEPIYQEMPSVLSMVEMNMPDNDETLYLDLSSSTDFKELAQNLSGTKGFKSYDEESISIPLWSFSDREMSYFEYVVGNIDSHYKNYTVNKSGEIDIELEDNYSASDALKSFSDWYKIVYGGPIHYAQVHAKLVISASSLEEFKDNLLDRGIVASRMEGPVQDNINSTNESSVSSTTFVLITGAVGVVFALMGIYVDSVVVYYRRFRKFVNTKRKR